MTAREKKLKDRDVELLEILDEIMDWVREARRLIRPVRHRRKSASKNKSDQITGNYMPAAGMSLGMLQPFVRESIELVSIPKTKGKKRPVAKKRKGD